MGLSKKDGKVTKQKTEVLFLGISMSVAFLIMCKVIIGELDTMNDNDNSL